MSPRAQEPLSIEYILLGLVSEQPTHGYDIFKRLQKIDGINQIWTVKQANTYALLERFENMGLVSSELLAGESFVQRKQYRITPAGHEEFERWMNTPVSHGRDMRQEFLARLYFARQAGADQALELIDKQYEECLGWLDEIIEDRKKGNDDAFAQLVIEFRAAQIEAMIHWLEESRYLFK
ncbi:MAG TPA: helix-turn-helix transcriptional regulator [Bellilinea sp.]|jgi:DNA-binding PadR family transcriptional regulator|nr:helix-turn-helix transcriptional regulator [Bellilinea sp.]